MLLEEQQTRPGTLLGKIAQEMNITDAIYEFEGALSELYTSTGHHDKALAHYKKSVAARDSMFNVSTAEKNVRLEMNYEFEKKQAFEKAQHEKEIIAMEADNKIQRQLRIFLLVFTALILVSNHIGDEGARALAESPFLANLAELKPLDNRISSAGVSALRDRFGKRVRIY